jgi:hypothetical protein
LRNWSYVWHGAKCGQAQRCHDPACMPSGVSRNKSKTNARLD